MSADLKTRVQELIDSMINPAVAGHGGFVELIDVQDNRVYLQMGGGCQGCGAADVTLKSGIERLIKGRSRRSPRSWTRPTTPPAPTLTTRRAKPNARAAAWAGDASADFDKPVAAPPAHYDVPH